LDSTLISFSTFVSVYTFVSFSTFTTMVSLVIGKKFVIKGMIGKGAYGDVYLGMDKTNSENGNRGPFK
jgi:hypothetical protein